MGWLPLERGGAKDPLLAKTLLLVRVAAAVADSMLLLRCLPRLLTGGALVVQGSVGVAELVRRTSLVTLPSIPFNTQAVFREEFPWDTVNV